MARIIMIEDQRCDEAVYMWGKIVEKYGDTKCLNETFNEVWQYMGTVENAGRWFHQFRHRAFPGSNARKLDNIPVSRGFKVDNYKEMVW